MNTRIDGASCQIIPDDLYTSGEPSLNRLAAAAGDRFDVWQRQINRIILAKSADGFWSARNVALSIPRQTGISEAARLGFKRIIVSGYLGKGGKRPKGIEIVTINSIDQLPRALFVE